MQLRYITIPDYAISQRAPAFELSALVAPVYLLSSIHKGPKSLPTWSTEYSRRKFDAPSVRPDRPPWETVMWMAVPWRGPRNPKSTLLQWFSGFTTYCPTAAETTVWTGHPSCRPNSPCSCIASISYIIVVVVFRVSIETLARIISFTPVRQSFVSRVGLRADL